MSVKIIPIANQKGGTGKTTHCITFSNYLKLIKEEEVLVLDMDFQSNFKSSWDSDRQRYDNPPIYEVIDIELSESANVLQQIAPMIHGLKGRVIIDLPGKIDDEDLFPVYKNADMIICPFIYDERSYKSTFVFAQVVKHLNPKAPIVFLPNRIKHTVKYETMLQSNEALSKLGTVAPPISDRIAFSRVDTFTIPSEIKEQILNCYDFIYDSFLKPIKQ